MPSQYFRPRNLFARPQPPGIKGPFHFPPPLNSQQAVEEEEEFNRPKGYDLSKIYGEMMNMEPGPAQQRFKQFIDEEMPNRDNYKPGKMRKFGAVLAGIGEGVQRGGAAGFDTTRGILDSDYNRAIDDYKLQGDKLAKAADLEEKNVLNRVKTFRDVEEYNAKMANVERQNRLTDAQVENYKSLQKTREADLQTKGWDFTTRATDGHRIGTKLNPKAPGVFFNSTLFFCLSASRDL